MNTKLVLSVVTVTALALAPLGVKKMIDNSVEQKKLELNEIGLSLSIEKDKGYINSVRDFNITIKDEIKFKEYFKNVITEINPVTKVFLGQFSNEETKDLDEFLKGIVFKGNIENSNLNPFSDIKVYTYLHTLSDKVMSEIKKDKNASEAFMPLFEEESIALNMLFDSNSKLKTLALKDIENSLKSSFEVGKAESSLNIKGFNVVNNSNQDKLIANIGLERLKISNTFEFKELKSESKTFVEGVDYKINYKNEFVNNIDLKVKSIEIGSGNQVLLKSGINLGESKISTSGNIINEIYSAKSDIYIQDFKFTDKPGNVVLDKLNLNIDLNDMDYKSLKKLSKTYIESFSESMNYVSLPRKQRRNKIRMATENLLNDAVAFVNKGLSLKVDSNLEKLKFNTIKVDSAKFNLDALLKKNDINAQSLNFNPLAILSLLNVNANLEMPEEDFVSLSKNINTGVSRMARRFVKNENGKAVFSLKLENGQLEINGNKVR